MSSKLRTVALLSSLVLALHPSGFAEETAAPQPEAETPAAAAGIPNIPGVEFQPGPGKGSLSDQASVAVPEGYLFTGAAGTQRLMEMMENPVSGNEIGFLAPHDISWFVVFEYDDIGYVKDDEKDNLDAEAMLKSFREGTEAGNKIRRERGWGTLEILGWETPPAYNPATHNVEWATRAKDSEGGLIINHNIRLLGRSGVMSAVLVADPEKLATAASATRELLASGYAFNSGKTYAEFRQGDKIAKYGLVGLITGGAAVVAAKSGLLAKFWKLLLIPIVAVGAWLKKLFKRNDTTSAA